MQVLTAGFSIAMGGVAPPALRPPPEDIYAIVKTRAELCLRSFRISALRKRGLTIERAIDKTAGMATSSLTIDLSAIQDNWRALARASSCATGAVVKANGYGLGAAEVARSLRTAGAREFFVAVAEEGRTVRQVLGPDVSIFVFSGHMDTDTDLIRDFDLAPLLNSPEQVARHLDRLSGHGFGVQLDTGMNRLGIEADEWARLRAHIMAHGPDLVMSHLACADEPAHPMNKVQLTAFKDMTDGLPVRRSLAATGGILLGPEYHFDITRPGIGLYGGLPFADAAPVVRVDVPVIQVRTVLSGESVGYGNAWIAARDSQIATVSAGYADGIARAIGGAAELWAEETPCPLVGRVSMDLITVDVTDLAVAPEVLSLLGPKQSVDDLARAAGTIGYEVLTSLGARYERRYVG